MKRKKERKKEKSKKNVGLNSTTAVLLGWFLLKISHIGWYTIKQNNTRRMFANGPGGRSSIPGHVIPKT